MHAHKITITSLAIIFLLGANITSISGLSFNTEIGQAKIEPYANDSNNTVTINVSTDKSNYKLGENVVISGKVSQVVEEEEVTVAVFGPDDDEITIDYLPVKNDGSFQGTIQLKENYPSGRYTLEVGYASQVRFIEFSVGTISDKSNTQVTINVSTDKSNYKLGENVVISGKVSQVVEEEVTVAVFGPDDDEITIDYLPVNKDGSFKGSISLTDSNLPGRYTLEVNYVSHIVYVEFFVETKNAGSSSPTINVDTDLEQYRPGNAVTVSGHAPFVKDKLVKVDILYPNGSSYKTSEVSPNNDGSFTYSFKLEDRPIIGTYTVTVTYLGSTATTTFTIIELTNLTVSTDKQTYLINNKIKISGTSSGITGSVSIQVLNPANKVYVTKEVKPNSDGTYSFEFILNGELATKGTYTVIVSYEKNNAKSSFELTQAAPIYIPTTTSSGKVDYSGKQYIIPYSITSSLSLDMKIYQGNSLVLNLGNNTKNNGVLQITLPRELIDARVGAKDVSFRVVIDGKETGSTDVTKTSTIRTVEIPFLAGSQEIRIIGTVSEVQNQEQEKIGSETKTILFLTPPPETATIGEQLTFNGVLKTAGRGALQNSTIWIRSIDSSGSEPNLVSGVTDSAGKFAIKWSPKSSDVDKRLNVFVVYEGENNFLKSRSPIFSIDIENKKEVKTVTDPFYVAVDREYYNLGETVILKGTVKDVGRSETVGIFVTDPKQRFFVVAQAKIEPDKSFTYPFWLSDDHTIKGVYTVEVEYMKQAVTTTFSVGGIRASDVADATLVLNQPPSVITKGDTVLFTGLLKARDKPLAITNATISIKHKQPDGQTLTLALGQTDAKGRFMIKWLTDNIADLDTVRAYAYFERLGFHSAASKEFQINISDKLFAISASTDKANYSLGDTVRITGQISERIDGVPVAIQVFDPHTLSFKFDTAQVNADGSFKYDFKLNSASIIKGKYTIKISYLESTVIKEIEVNNEVAEPLTVAKVSLEDPIGLPINRAFIGKALFIKSFMKNNLSFEQEFTYIVQIKDSSGNTVMLDWRTKQVSEGDRIYSEIRWIPELNGDYRISIFVWESLDEPVPLAVNHAVHTFTVQVI